MIATITMGNKIFDDLHSSDYSAMLTNFAQEKEINEVYQKQSSNKLRFFCTEMHHFETLSNIARCCDLKLSNLSKMTISLVQSMLAACNLAVWTKFQVFCVLFSLLLLNSDFAEARARYPSLSLKWKMDKDSSKLSSVAINKIPDDTFYSASGSFTFSMGEAKSHIVKRSTTSRKNFLRHHRRPQRLVTKYGHFIEIRKNGKVKGTRKRNVYSVFEFISVRTGILAIRGIKTGKYLAMDRKGNLIGMNTYSANFCNFHEELAAGRYFVYFQYKQYKGKRRNYIKQLFMGFDNRGKPKKGRKVHRNDNSAHFQKFPAVYPLKRRRKRPKRVKPKKIFKRKNT